MVWKKTSSIFRISLYWLFKFNRSSNHVFISLFLFSTITSCKQNTSHVSNSLCIVQCFTINFFVKPSRPGKLKSFWCVLIGGSVLSGRITVVETNKRSGERNMYSISHEICTVHRIKYVQYFPLNMYSISHQICTTFSIKYVQYFPSNMYSIFHQICTVFSIKYVQYIPSNMYSIFHQICTVYSIKHVQYIPSNMYSIFHQICTVFSVKHVQYFPSNMYSIFHQICTVFSIKYV